MPKTFLLLLLFPLSFSCLAQSRIELLGADELSGIERNGVKLVRLIGNVSFRQDNATMRCDSAYQDKAANTFEAFGRVYINEKDSVTLNSRYLRYNGNEKKAFVRDEVVMSDGQMTLTTDQLDYDLKTRVAFYGNGGHVVNQDNVLDSRIGSYSAESKTFGFKKNVVLVNPEYVLKTDTLQYNTLSKTAWFFGPTTIEGEDGFIYCENGWYNTYTQRARFSRNAYVINEEYRLSADSLLYGGKMGIDTALSNVWLKDSVNKLVISGQRGVYNRNTSVAVVTSMPLASVLMDDDSLHIVSDTLRSTSDSSKRKSIYAYHKVRFFKSDMQGICDSLHYSQADSMIYMERDPVLWNENRQMTADSIRLQLLNNKPERVDFIQNAFIIEEVDTGLYNQLRGNVIRTWFRNDRIHRVHVKGNAENVYFQEDDSITLSSMNYVICSEVSILFDSAGKAQEITYIQQPEGTDYPINRLPGGLKQQLKGFTWRSEERPLSKKALREEGLTAEPTLNKEEKK